MTTLTRSIWTLTMYKTIRIKGPKATEFLQGQFCTDLKRLHDHDTQLAAYCNLKGRVVASFWLHRLAADHYLIAVPGDTIDNLINPLLKYGTFSKVDIDIDNAIQWQYEPSIPTVTPCDSPDNNEAKWQATLIKKGIALIHDPSSEQFLPQMLNYQNVDVVSFTKGCYLGQEIVARTQHLGKLKQKLYRLTFVDGAPTGVQVGTDVVHQDKVLGMVVAKDEAFNLLAVLRIAELENTGEVVFANGKWAVEGV